MSGANPDVAAPSGQANGHMEMDTDAPAASPSQQPSELPSSVVQDHDTAQSRRLVKTLLDQAHLSPFPLDKRPVHWDFGHVLSLYPLPSALVLADPDAPAFALNYNGCAVLNPGRIVEGRRGERARWVEFDVLTGRGVVRVEDV